MPKTKLKEEIIPEQNGKCALSDEELSENLSLIDTDRKNPKANGGTYTDRKNVRIVEPRAHMERHGNLREREPMMETLKEQIDAREQLLKLFNKVNNQLLAYERNVDYLDAETVAFLESSRDDVHKRMQKQSRLVEKTITKIGEVDPLATAALNIGSVGPMTVAYCLHYIDLEKARHASSLWSYVGLDKPSHERYQKGESSGGNKKLRCALWRMADSQIKGRGAYREVYDRAKERKRKSSAMVKSRNTQGKMVEIPWSETKPCHADGHAKRMVMKHFLADYWYVGRTLRGLETTPIYAEAVIKSGHRMIMPEERGWVY